MRLFRFALSAILLVILGVAVYQTMRWLGVWGDRNESQVRSLDDGDQEIALIEPATSTDDWGRLVTALKLIEQDWPRLNPSLPALRLQLDDAFPPLTAAVPEIVLSFANTPRPKLRLRWYKISGEHSAASWIDKLHARNRPPLAVIGGGTSDRAVALARALQESYPDAEAAGPVFLITTATAENSDEDRKLIEEYPKRSFRFSFTNQRIVEALLKFVQQTPNLWVNQPAEAANRQAMYAFYWQDERYSKDLTLLFMNEFRKRYPNGEFFDEGGIQHAVGDFFRPAPEEQAAVGTFVSSKTPIPPRSFLVLPTQTVRMRRFLINLYQRSPQDARNLVILNGDAISFNSVFRDHDVLWNVSDVPYSLVFFAHRNPIDRAAGFSDRKDEQADFADAFPQRTSTGTHDVLLYRDLFESLLYAACDNGRLLGDPVKVRERLNATAWRQPPPEQAGAEAPRVCNTLVHDLQPPPRRFFSRFGDRRKDTGEHIVWVKPNFIDDRPDLTSKIGVWTMSPNTNGDAWRLVGKEPFHVKYNQTR